MRGGPRTSILIVALLVASTGCGSAATSAAAPPASSPAVPSPTWAAPGPATETPRPTAVADVSAALQDAGADGRPVLLDFGASWCPDCAALAHIFATPTVSPVLAGFHLVEIDIGKFDRNIDLAARYGIDFRKSGIPALVVLSPQGRVVATTADGSFAEAQTMTAGQVADRLRQWAG